MYICIHFCMYRKIFRQQTLRSLPHRHASHQSYLGFQPLARLLRAMPRDTTHTRRWMEQHHVYASSTPSLYRALSKQIEPNLRYPCRNACDCCSSQYLLSYSFLKWEPSVRSKKPCNHVTTSFLNPPFFLLFDFLRASRWLHCIPCVDISV